MSKKSRFILLFSIFIIISGISVFYWGAGLNNYEPVIDEKIVPIKHELIELQNTDKFKKLTKEDKIKEINSVLDNLPAEYGKLKKQYQVAMGSLPEIYFFGRVIDQYNQAVSGAEIYYRGTNAYLSEGSGTGYAVTDKDGYFKLRAVGASLVLGKVTRPGIEYSYKVNSYFGEASGGKRLKLSQRFVSIDSKSGGTKNWKNYSSKDKAYIIQAWRLGEYNGAIKDRAILDLNGDGRIYTVNLNEKNRRKTLQEGQLEKGDFYITCKRDPIKSYKDYKDWYVSITPVTGGIQKTEDLFMNVAPETGYKPGISIDMKLGTDEYKDRLFNQRYYFNINNGINYGSFLIEYDPFSNIKENLCRIKIFYKYNPKGSKSLELKKKKIKSGVLPETSLKYASTN